MPFLSPKRKVSDAENKLRILFCLDKLGMATQEQLWPFMAKLELMEYIPFCMFVDELRSDGAIASGVHAMEGSLFLTAAGRQQLELFSGRMVHADKERITREAPEYAQHLSQRRLVRAAYELSQEGEFRAFGTVCEGDVPTLLLHVRSRDEKLIERFVNVFPSVARRWRRCICCLWPAPARPCLRCARRKKRWKPPLMISPRCAPMAGASMPQWCASVRTISSIRCFCCFHPPKWHGAGRRPRRRTAKHRPES